MNFKKQGSFDGKAAMISGEEANRRGHDTFQNCSGGY